MLRVIPWFSIGYLAATLYADARGLFEPIDRLSGLPFVLSMVPVGGLWLLGLIWGYERFDEPGQDSHDTHQPHAS